jgi:peptidyl-tRNA hydrolase, PTH1 family
MKIIIGLGNIGDHYNGTRHNIGFSVLDALAGAETWQNKDKFKAYIVETHTADQRVILVKPTTYYNLSGDALQALKQFYKVENKDILVIHDDISLPLGTIRIRSGGSDAGNNGLKSIIATIGPDFARVRVGTANEHTSAADTTNFVLGHFSHDEQPKLAKIIKKAQQLAGTFITCNLEDTTYQIDSNQE